MKDKEMMIEIVKEALKYRDNEELRIYLRDLEDEKELLPNQSNDC